MINLQDLPSFIDYFRKLATEHRKLKGFAHGPATRIIALDRSTLDYPALWLETPTFQPGDNDADNTSGTWSGAIVVLQNTDSDYEQEDQAWAETLGLLNAVLSRLMKDFPRRFHLLKPIDPISPMFVSKLVGWRYEFDIMDELDLTFKPEDWEEAQ